MDNKVDMTAVGRSSRTADIRRGGKVSRLGCKAHESGSARVLVG